ncbi:hypothetical protein [Marivivens aquimaris]|uniref:hypothetical protein n=1 Tax=Marivivens aquimaris TaxID=2774876 RepID=UPI0018803B54|nr:hypothetical protein [Marivivens aquimaris]
MPPRKPKRTSSKPDDEEEMTEAEQLTDSINRALESARLADDAAQDIETIKKAHDAFVVKVQQSQKKLGAMAIGALVGGLLATTIAGLIYFRSVNDLRENAELQAEALAAIVAQTAALQEVVTQAGNQQGAMQTVLTSHIDEATERLSAEMALMATQAPVPEPEEAGTDDNMVPQMMSGVNDTITAKIDEVHEDLLGAITDLDLSLTNIITETSGGMGDETRAQMTEMIGELRTAIAAAQTAAARPAPAPTPTPTRAATTTRPAPRPAPAPAPNPFSIP